MKHLQEDVVVSCAPSVHLAKRELVRVAVGDARQARTDATRVFDVAQVMTTGAAAPDEGRTPRRYRASVLVSDGWRLGLGTGGSILVQQESGQIAQLIVCQAVLQHRGLRLHAMRIL